MNLENIGSVLERVFLPAPLRRQLARLSHWDEARGQFVGDGSTENESAALDRDDVRNAGISEGGGHRARRREKRVCVADQRSDVLEDDSGLWVIGNVADQLGRAFGKIRHVGRTG